MALHTLSICTGLGGIERGLAIAAPEAFKPILYCEREISVAAVIADEIERGGLPAAPIWSDVKTLTRGSVAKYLDQVGVDCITGGYPCQPFSVAGKRRGEDDPRHLWPWIAQAIERYAPGVLFFENVGGHLVLGFPEVCECLERMGFRVAAGLFTASEIGAGHRRERLFILGLANGWCERPQRHGEGGTTEGAVGRRGGTDVANARSGGQRQRRAESARQSRAFETGCPSYPPGPTSPDWQWIVEQWPELAPAVGNASGNERNRNTQQHSKPNTDGQTQRRRDAMRSSVSEAAQPAFRGVADGISRADQLRAYGNAVVPDCAAVAFITLWAALNH